MAVWRWYSNLMHLVSVLCLSLCLSFCGNSIVYRNHRIYGGSPTSLCWLWWQSTIWKLSEMVDYHHIQVLIWWKVIIWCRSTIIFYVIARAMACRPVRVQTVHKFVTKSPKFRFLFAIKYTVLKKVHHRGCDGCDKDQLWQSYIISTFFSIVKMQKQKCSKSNAKYCKEVSWPIYNTWYLSILLHHHTI